MYWDNLPTWLVKVPTDEAAVFNTELLHELQLPQSQPDYNQRRTAPWTPGSPVPTRLQSTQNCSMNSRFPSPNQTTINTELLHELQVQHKTAAWTPGSPVPTRLQSTQNCSMNSSYLWFLCHMYRVFRASPQFFFTKRRISVVIAFLEGSHKMSSPLPPKSHFGEPFNANLL